MGSLEIFLEGEDNSKGRLTGEVEVRRCGLNEGKLEENGLFFKWESLLPDGGVLIVVKLAQQGKGPKAGGNGLRPKEVEGC